MMIWLLFAVIFLLGLYGCFKKITFKEGFAAIPKIIHQFAPADKSKWPLVWVECQESWLNLFPAPEYEYRMWNDEDLDTFMQVYYPGFYETYTSYEFKIQRIDVARYFVLYKYCGIYADMDYECLTNFYDLLPSNKVSISESTIRKNEILQNSLMISPVGHEFWEYVTQLALERSKINDFVDHDIYKRNDLTRQEKIVLYQTGPVLISDVYVRNESMVNMLPQPIWNAGRYEDGPNIIAKQYGTCSWKEPFENLGHSSLS